MNQIQIECQLCNSLSAGNPQKMKARLEDLGENTWMPCGSLLAGHKEYFKNLGGGCDGRDTDG